MSIMSKLNPVKMTMFFAVTLLLLLDEKLLIENGFFVQA